jgi:hypothetical protein
VTKLIRYNKWLGWTWLECSAHFENSVRFMIDITNLINFELRAERQLSIL